MRESGALKDALAENAKIEAMLTKVLEGSAIAGTSGDELHRMAPTVKM